MFSGWPLVGLTLKVLVQKRQSTTTRNELDCEDFSFGDKRATILELFYWRSGLVNRMLFQSFLNRDD